MRTAKIERNTFETQIKVELNIDGTGKYENNTGVGFLDHMLDLFAKHIIIGFQFINKVIIIQFLDFGNQRCRLRFQFIDAIDFSGDCFPNLLVYPLQFICPLGIETLVFLGVQGFLYTSPNGR